MKRLEKMRRDAFLINCARGELVKEDALYEALLKGKIKEAALDAYVKEHVFSDNPLLRLDNVIVSPHNAAFTSDTLVRM